MALNKLTVRDYKTALAVQNAANQEGHDSKIMISGCVLSTHRSEGEIKYEMIIDRPTEANVIEYDGADPVFASEAYYGSEGWLPIKIKAERGTRFTVVFTERKVR